MDHIHRRLHHYTFRHFGRYTPRERKKPKLILLIKFITLRSCTIKRFSSWGNGRKEWTTARLKARPSKAKRNLRKVHLLKAIPTRIHATAVRLAVRSICVVHTNGLTATRVINENDSGGYCVRDGVSITSSWYLSVLFFRFSPERLYEYWGFK